MTADVEFVASLAAVIAADTAANVNAVIDAIAEDRSEAERAFPALFRAIQWAQRTTDFPDPEIAGILADFAEQRETIQERVTLRQRTHTPTVNQGATS